MYKKVQNNYPTLIGGTLFPGQYACTIDSQSPYQQNHSQLKLTMKKKQDKYNYEHPYCTDRYIVVSLSSDKCTLSEECTNPLWMYHCKTNGIINRTEKHLFPFRL